MHLPHLAQQSSRHAMVPGSGFDIGRHPEQSVRQPENGRGDGHFVDDLGDAVTDRWRAKAHCERLLAPPAQLHVGGCASEDEQTWQTLA